MAAGSPRQFHLEDRQIVPLVSGHVPGLIGPARVHGDGAVPSPRQHVVIGEDITVRPEDDPGAHGDAVVQLDHDRHHRRVHPLVDLLGRQLPAVVRLHLQHGALPERIVGMVTAPDASSSSSQPWS